MGIPDHITCLPRNLYIGWETIVSTRHGTIDGSKLGKEYIKALYCHPVYLTCMQAGWLTIWNQNCWEKYQQPQICRWYHSNGRKWRTKEPLHEDERGEWKKAGLKHSLLKTKIMASDPITSWQIDGEKVETVRFHSWVPKSLQMVTTKLKDACSLEE